MDAAVLTQWVLSASLGGAAGAWAVRSIFLRRLALSKAQHAEELEEQRSQQEQASVELKNTLVAEHERALRHLQDQQAAAIQTERVTCQREAQSAAEAAEARIASLIERHAQQLADMQARMEVQTTAALVAAEREHQKALTAERDRLLIQQEERLDAAEKRFEERLEKVESPLTLLVHPFVNSSGTKIGPIYNSNTVQLGYKYQLLVQGMPCFDPHEVVIETQSKVEIDEKALAEWAGKAAALAQEAVNAKVGGIPGRIVSFASTVLQGRK
jgi:hypothetical protein